MTRIIFLLAILLSTTGVADETISFSTILLEGDPVSGAGSVQFIENLAINDAGDWIVECNTDFVDTDQDGVLIKNGDIFLREGIVGQIDAPPNAFVDIFDSVNINNNGNAGINLFIDPLASDQDSGVYLNEMLVIQEGDLATAAGLSADTPFVGFFDTKINGHDVIMMMASIDDPEIVSTVDRAILLVDTNTGEQTVIAKEGDILADQTEQVEDFATGPHSSAFNDNGEVMYIAELEGNSTTDNAVYINDTLIAQEGMDSPISGRPYEFIADRGLDLNNNGDYVFKANLVGDASTDDVLVKNGEVFKQEGDSAPGGFSFTSFGPSGGPLRIGDNGRVIWFGEWDDPDTSRNTGIFVDDRLIVQSGVTEIDGELIEEVEDIQDSFAISPDGSKIIFEADLAGGINGAFIVELRDVILGDINGDGNVDLLDVAPFVELIKTGTYQIQADLNCDGEVNLVDVAPFVELLSGG